MIRRVQGVFRAIPAGVTFDGIPLDGYNVIDLFGSNGGAVGGWTEGLTLLDQIDISDSIGRSPYNKSVSVLSFTVTAQLYLVTLQATVPVKAYGRLGRILAGVNNQGSQTTNSSNVLQITSPPMLAVPSEASFVAPLFDPAVNNLPPNVPFGVKAASLANPQIWSTAAGDLPQPLQVTPGGNLLAGIWLEPSLLSPDPNFGNQPSVSLACQNAKYVVLYDDGDNP